MAIPNLIYHYTNIEVLINGIFKKKCDQSKEYEICLWATHCEYLNDTFDSYLGDLLLHNNEEIKNILNPNLNFLFDNLKSKFIISFSESVDCLPMWNMYGKNGKGIALGFDFNKVICNSNYVDNFHRCIYENTEQYTKYYYTIVNKVKKIHAEGSPASEKSAEGKDAFIHGLIHGYAQLIKSHSFEYEKEWRIIIPSYKNDIPIEFRHRDGLLIPFIRQYLPKDSLTEIWIGPTSDIKRTEKAIRMYLNSIGFEHVTIKKSGIPFRN